MTDNASPALVPADAFHADAQQMSDNFARRSLIRVAMGKYDAARRVSENRYQDWQAARDAAAQIKWLAVNHLDGYLDEFARRATERGSKVFWAANAGEARSYILKTCRDAGARRIIKSKTMTGEEINLNDALSEQGFEITESDLGEFIVQLRREHPYHFVYPAMHLSRGEVSETFAANLGTPPTQSAEELTMIARRIMRERYMAADVGISGANFAVAETGMISITENEGNARLSTSLPRIHIALVGIEKVVPRMDDLALLLPMLSAAGAGQNLSAYNSLIGGPRLPGEIDGPDEFHIVLLDNGRTQLLADAEQRDALHCIRCGACLNVCPVFKSIGGHAYGTTYQGPIGSVITPHLRGLQPWKHLSGASSLCGACTQTCPVKVDLHHHLLQNRRNAAQDQPSIPERSTFRVFGFMATHPTLYRFVSVLAPGLQKLYPLIKGKKWDPLTPWTRTRELPQAASQTFRSWWLRRPDPRMRRK
jgi:L-lactate dehydrogenase complex protein LldF